MRIESLELLRCPYCGGRFEVDTSQFHQRTGEEIQDGILSCQCCNLPIVDGIPVLHLLPNSTTARFVTSWKGASTETQPVNPHTTLSAFVNC